MGPDLFHHYHHHSLSPIPLGEDSPDARSEEDLPTPSLLRGTSRQGPDTWRAPGSHPIIRWKLLLEYVPPSGGAAYAACKTLAKRAGGVLETWVCGLFLLLGTLGVRMDCVNFSTVEGEGKQRGGEGASADWERYVYHVASLRSMRLCVLCVWTVSGDASSPLLHFLLEIPSRRFLWGSRSHDPRRSLDLDALHFSDRLPCERNISKREGFFSISWAGPRGFYFRVSPWTWAVRLGLDWSDGQS